MRQAPPKNARYHRCMLQYLSLARSKHPAYQQVLRGPPIQCCHRLPTSFSAIPAMPAAAHLKAFWSTMAALRIDRYSARCVLPRQVDWMTSALRWRCISAYCWRAAMPRHNACSESVKQCTQQGSPLQQTVSHAHSTQSHHGCSKDWINAVRVQPVHEQPAPGYAEKTVLTAGHVRCAYNCPHVPIAAHDSCSLSPPNTTHHHTHTHTQHIIPTREG
jgi:hypothetical protein